VFRNENSQIDPNKVAVYIRWSTDEQGQGTTLEVQKEACDYYCKSQGWTFQEDLVFVDDGSSGASLERPALTALRQAVQSGEVGCVVVYKLDRLSRNLLDCVTLVRKEWGSRCALYSTKENFDTHSPVGQMVFNILVSFAEFERNVIRDRTLSGKRKRAEQGRNAGQRYPFGYKKGDDGEWAVDGWDEEKRCFIGAAAIARRVFDEFLVGMGTTSIADRLRREGIPAPMGGEWRFGAVVRMLSNPAYSGQYVYGMRNGERGKVGPPKSTVDGALPPIVTPKEFQTVQALRQARRLKAPRSLASDYLLSGLAKCGNCGHAVSGSMGATKRYYVCTNRILFKQCDCGYMGADRLETAFLAAVKESVSLANIRSHVEVMEAQGQQQSEEHAYAVRQAEEALSIVARKHKRLEEEFFAGNLHGNAYSRLSDRLAQEVQLAQDRLARAKTALDRASGPAVDVERLVDLAERVDAWAELTTEEVKQVLRDLVDHLTLYQRKAQTRSKRGNPYPLEVEWRPRLDLTVQASPVAMSAF
jgi:site-specific DNA recombinase